MLKRMEDIGGRFELVPGASGGALARLTIPLAPAPAAPAKATATVS
jgi:hypothetical protein